MSLNSDRVPVSLDFEFSRLPLPTESYLDWSNRVEILSLGLAAHEGESPDDLFYICRAITPEIERNCTSFVRRFVLDVMRPERSPIAARSDLEMSGETLAFLSSLTARHRKPVLVYSDWPGDLVLLQRLLGDACPEIAVAKEQIDAGLELNARECKNGLVEHNALDDAIRNARALQVLVMSCRTRDDTH